MTGSSGAGDREASAAAGMTRSLDKPVALAALAAELEAARAG